MCCPLEAHADKWPWLVASSTSVPSWNAPVCFTPSSPHHFLLLAFPGCTLAFRTYSSQNIFWMILGPWSLHYTGEFGLYQPLLRKRDSVKHFNKDSITPPQRCGFSVLGYHQESQRSRNSLSCWNTVTVSTMGMTKDRDTCTDSQRP